MNLYRPIVVGLNGQVLSRSEVSWLHELRPYGVILFSRNIESQPQLKALCASIREVLGNDVVIIVDQEGGRVQRLKDPNWPALPAALDIGKYWRKHQFAGLEAATVLVKSLALNLLKSVSRMLQHLSSICTSKVPILRSVTALTEPRQPK